MTVGTNALLEGKTARTALVATEGFADLEELGRQARPELYRLCAGASAARRAPRAAGRGAGALRARRGAARARRATSWPERLGELPADVEAVGVCLLWGFRHPAHERAVAASALPDVHVSLSHEVAGVFREYERLATTVVDAALSPLLSRYLARLTERTGEAGLPEPEVMLSSGGVAAAATAARHGSWTVLSGPAGGAVAAAQAVGGGGAVGLDMGGTSCDVSLVLDGRVAVTGGREVGGRSLALPMVDVHTVGAGGGSIAWRDEGGALRAGPRSAGAVPGPACYGRGGERADGDRRQPAARAPRPGCAAGGRMSSSTARRPSARSAASPGSSGSRLEETAEGIVRVANAEMAQAVRVVTVERGIDPRELALVAFGGAGPLHAAAIAEELGMAKVIAPVASGVLSALGLAVSERRRDLVESVLLAGDALTREAVAEVVERLAARGHEELPGGEVRATYDLRYAGQAFELRCDGAPRAGPGGPARRVRPRPRRALRLLRPGRRAGAGDRAGGRRAAGRRGRPPPARRSAEDPPRASRDGPRPRCSAPAAGRRGPACSTCPARRWCPPGWSAGPSEKVVMTR